MSLAPTLPSELAAWSEALDALTPELALALGPIVRRLAGLLHQVEPYSGSAGELEGLGGLSMRGDPSRMLLSEWLLADEAPLEFMRRAATGELLYLDMARRTSRSRGRVAVLVDTGPDQLGPGRLVQLAALVVLYRRAFEAGAELVVGVVSEAKNTWIQGSFPELLSGWLRSRTARMSGASDVAAWDDAADDADEVWLLAGPALAAQVPARRRTLVSQPSTWGSDRAAGVVITLAGNRIDLDIPASTAAIAALRGRAWRRTVSPVTHAVAPKHPLLPGPGRLLLARGGIGELLATFVPKNTEAPAANVRRYQFDGEILAASCVGRRIVVAVASGDWLQIRVVGKPFGLLDGTAFRVDQLATTALEVQRLAQSGLMALTHVNGNLLLHLAGQWWTLEASGSAVSTPLVAVAPAHRSSGLPRQAAVTSGILTVDGRGFPIGEARASVVFGAGQHFAWSTDDRVWHVYHPERPGPALAVEEGSRVLGMLAFAAGKAALVTLSSAGHLLRIVSAQGTQTVSRWSAQSDYSMHPRLPLLAFSRPRADGIPEAVEVVDLESRTSLLTLTELR